MNRTVEDLQRHLEIISADQEVFAITLQVLLLNMAISTDAGRDLVRTMRRQVLDSIENTGPSLGDPQGAERKKQLTKMRATDFFRAIAEAAEIDVDKPEPSTTN